MKPTPLLLACLLYLPTFGHAESGDAAAHRQIEAVIEAFRTSIIDKDKARFVKLFLYEDIPWQDVMSDTDLQRRREKQPDARKVTVSPRDRYLSFIDGIVADTAHTQEQFRNVRIDTDGDIASVFFDYSFHADQRETNHGKEAWHLVRTDDGWKIISVIYSMNLTVQP